MTPENFAFQKAVFLVSTYFGHDRDKITEWWSTETPLLDNAAPIDFIQDGRTEKLLQSIENWLSGDMP